MAPLSTRLQIDLTCLRDLASENIKSQLNEKNIVQELFSPFTAESAVPRIIAISIPDDVFYPAMRISDECSMSYSIRS